MNALHPSCLVTPRSKCCSPETDQAAENLSELDTGEAVAGQPRWQPLMWEDDEEGDDEDFVDDDDDLDLGDDEDEDFFDDDDDEDLDDEEELLDDDE